MKKVVSFLLAALMLVACFAGCAKEEQKEMTYSMIDMFDITTLDYVYNNKSSNGDYTNNFIEGLLTQDNHGTLIPGMATEWKSNDDATVWTFKIRDDANWVTNEGEVYAKVTAEDFVSGFH
ncbi:MAG: peptide ABC transporter substrate-binding protein, partial [Clostridia bacterium]|nr:peptide ABC transporter substrate-binding protein [Clostridia bacterium]